jgi:hypothetical protein
MAQRRLAAFVVPLAHARWALLRFDGEAWFLRHRAAPGAEQAVERVQVALEWGQTRWIRLQWGLHGWRGICWPHEVHLWLMARELGSLWPLIGAALAQHECRPWLGRR